MDALYDLFDSVRVERSFIYAFGDFSALFVIESCLRINRDFVRVAARRTLLPSSELIRPAACTSKMLPLTSETASIANLFDVIRSSDFRPLLRLLLEQILNVGKVEGATGESGASEK